MNPGEEKQSNSLIDPPIKSPNNAQKRINALTILKDLPPQYKTAIAGLACTFFGLTTSGCGVLPNPSSADAAAPPGRPADAAPSTPNSEKTSASFVMASIDNKAELTDQTVISLNNSLDKAQEAYHQKTQKEILLADKTVLAVDKNAIVIAPIIDGKGQRSPYTLATYKNSQGENETRVLISAIINNKDGTDAFGFFPLSEENSQKTLEGEQVEISASELKNPLYGYTLKSGIHYDQDFQKKIKDAKTPEQVRKFLEENVQDFFIIDLNDTSKQYIITFEQEPSFFEKFAGRFTDLFVSTAHAKELEGGGGEQETEEATPPPTSTPAPESTSTPTILATAEQQIETPTQESTPTPTSEPSPTQTTEPTPTEVIQQTPEQQLTEYMKTDEAKKSVDQFINAMKMAGIEVSVDQVNQELNIQDYNSFMIGSYNISKDDVSYAVVFTYTEKDGWKNTTKVMADLLNLKFGTLIEPDTSLSYQEFNMGAAHVEWQSPGSNEAVKYNYAKRQIAFDQSNGISNFGIYHLIDPVALYDWLGTKNYSPEELQNFLKITVEKGIRTFPNASFYIVINEPYAAPDITGDLFYTNLGNNYDYIKLAFQTATNTIKEINPEAKLILNNSNNFSLDDPEEKGFTTALTQQIANNLKGEGFDIGVGIQAHIRAGNPPSKDDLIRTMQSYGTPVYLTEVDVDMSDIGGSQEERLALQAKIYKNVVEACFESGVCSSMTFWGIGDNQSWLEVDQGKQNADPTLFFDRDKNGECSPKPAYYAISQVLQNQLSLVFSK